jgi:hypothetical protein
VKYPAVNDLERAEAILQEVLLLTRRVIEQKQAWTASPADEALMYSVASLMGRSLVPETFKSAAAALALLLLARFWLEELIGDLSSGSDEGPIPAVE